MSNNRQIDIKLSADKFEVKNIEIINGRIELILSADIAESSIEKTVIEENLNYFSGNDSEFSDSTETSIAAFTPDDGSRFIKVESNVYIQDEEESQPEHSAENTDKDFSNDTEQRDIPQYDIPDDHNSDDTRDKETPPPAVRESNTELPYEQDSSRYGEPEEDIEWQAIEIEASEPEDIDEPVVAADEAAADEIPDYIAPEDNVTPEISDSVQYTEDLPEYLNDDTEVTSEIQPPQEKNHSSSIPLATPQKDQSVPDYISPSVSQNYDKPEVEKSELNDDSLPEYLQKSVPSETSHQTLPNYIKEAEDDLPADKSPDESLRATHPEPEPPHISSSQPSVLPVGNDDALKAQPEEKEKRQEEKTEPITVKKVRFICPKCKTPGSQPIDKIGSIITCTHCGRAMKLNIKK